MIEQEGVDIAELRKLYPEQYADRDIFDIVCNVAFKQKTLSRKDRAGRVREQKLLDRYHGEARRVLEILLDTYATHGIIAFENQDALKVSEIAQIGTPVFIKTTLFGGSANFKSLIHEIEDIFYQPVLQYTA